MKFKNILLNNPWAKEDIIKKLEKAGEVGAVQGYEKIKKIQSTNLDGSQLKTTTQT